ncbi:hypothetical protein TWF718_003947 [Orbilia javanica]|uniref:Uncharacterized protein n=1 Tax=Orbilia javanica TaxID=47235 RepID=A0AAN8MX59_9PEZI
MEMKEISKNPENSYDTPEKTTNHVLNVVADMKVSTLDIKGVRVGTNDDDLVHVEKRSFGRKKMVSEGSGRSRTDEYIVRSCRYLGAGHNSSPAIVVPPGLPVETFAYG